MNRRLIVMRHAKSSWAEPGMPDHARPLNDRGIRDAPNVARKLCEIGWSPEIVLSSDARRTRQTFSLMSDELPGVECHFSNELYLSSIREVVAQVATVPVEKQSVMVLGHNPGWEHVVQYLCGEEVVMKTATAALLTLQSESWNDAMRCAGSWELLDVIYPREIDS